MKKYLPLIIVFVTILVIVVGYFVLFTEKPSGEKVEPPTIQNNSVQNSPEEAINSEANAISNGGQYLTYQDYQTNKAKFADSKTVLFFNAKWCPTCKALNSDIEQNISKIPEGVAIVSVDYDNYQDLKKQYGVTYQHTLVQIDNNGSQIKKWSGGNTLDTIIKQI